MGKMEPPWALGGGPTARRLNGSRTPHTYNKSNWRTTRRGCVRGRVSLRVVTATNFSLRDEMEHDGVGAAVAVAFRGDPSAVISRFRDRRELIKSIKAHRRCYRTGRQFIQNVVAAESLAGARLLDARGEITAAFDAALNVAEQAGAAFISVEVSRHELSHAVIARLPILRSALEQRGSHATTEIVITSDWRAKVLATWSASNE
jgi:hypothetical protein